MSELYDDEKTKKLDELKNLEDYDLSSPKEELKKETLIEPKKKKQKLCQRLKNNWHDLSKKKKLLVAFLSVFLLATITVGTILILKSFKKDEKPTKKPDQIVVKDNYSYENGVLTFLNSESKAIGTYKCTNKEEELCYVAYVSDEDGFDTPKAEYEDGKKVKVRTQIYFDKYVFIYDNKEAEKGIITLYNIATGKSEEYYQTVKSYDLSVSNLLVLKNSDSQYGLVEMTTDGIKTKIDFKYDFMGIIYDQGETDKYAAVETKDKWYLVDYNGKVVTSGMKYKILGYSNGYLKMKDEANRYLVSDFTGKLVSEGHKYVYLVDNYYLYVDSENKLFIKDFNNNKMNEDGIILFNSDYGMTAIYNEEGTRVKTKYAALITPSPDTLSITINDGSEDGKTIHVDLNEGNVSKSLKFYSYFGGKLYFYEDEAKETVIGSYPCTNTNQDLTQGLKSCFPASDTIYENNEMEDSSARNSMIPIFNQKYVFVYDSPATGEASDVSIKLYDLSSGSSKPIGTYASVNTYTPDNGGILTHVNTDSANIIIKNKSNKFGMIEISESGVSKVYDFSYNAMEKLGEYILVQSSNNKWKLLLGNLISTIEYDGKVVNYNEDYVKVLKGTRYYVYDYEGQQVLDTSYKFVDLYEDYVAVVDDSNKVTLYDYNNTNVISGHLSLNSNAYLDSEKPAFKVLFATNRVTISILNGDTYTDYQYDLTTGDLVI